MAGGNEPLKLQTTRWVWLYGAAGVVLSIVLIPWCATMLNHDRFMAALLLFPLPMTWIMNVGGETATFCVLASAQFPIYGVFLGYGRGVGGLPSFGAFLGIAHLVSLGICFMSFL